MDQAVEEGAGGQYHGTCLETHAELRHRTGDAVALDDQVIAGLGKDGQVRLVFQAGADRLLVQHAVGLRTRRTHRRPFRTIEDAELDAGFVGGCGHGAAQRIDFLDQMPLADSADGRVAAHRPQRFHVVREQQRALPHACRGERRLSASMAATDDNHIETFGIKHGIGKLLEISGERGRILRQFAEK